MRWVLCSLLFIASSSLKGQPCTIDGYAKLVAVDEIQSSVSVQILDEEKQNVLRFTTVTQGDTFHFVLPSRQIYTLRVAAIGYSDTIILINCRTSRYHQSDVKLRPLIEELSTFTLSEQIQLFTSHGDTTVVAVQQLASGREQSVTELLERIPGIELSGDQFTYRGRQLEDVTVEGRSVTGGRHRSVTDVLRPETVADVQLIENYTEDLAQSSNDDSAPERMGLNIRLTEKTRSRRQYLAVLGGGLPNRGQGGLSGIRAARKAASRSSIDVRNTKTARSNTNLEQLLQRIGERQRYKNYARLTEFLDPSPEEIVSPRALRSAWLSQLVHAWDRGKEARERWKGTIQAGHDHGRGAGSRELFTLDSPSNPIQQSWINTATETQVFGNNDYRFAKDSFRVALRLPYNWIRTNGIDYVETILSAESYTSVVSRQNSRISIRPSYDADLFIAPRVALFLYGRTLLTHQSPTIALREDTPSGSLAWLLPDSVGTSIQSRSYRDFYTNNHIGIRFNPIKQLNWETQLFYESRRETFEVASGNITVRGFVGRRLQLSARGGVATHLRVDTDQWLLTAGGVLERVQLLSGTADDRRWSAAPSLTLQRRLSKYWTLVGSYRSHIERPGLRYQNDLNRLLGVAELAVSNVPISRFHLVQTYQLGVRYLPKIAIRSGRLLMNARYEPSGFRFRTIREQEAGRQRILYTSVAVQNTYGATATYFRSTSAWNFRLRPDYRHSSYVYAARKIDETQWLGEIMASYRMPGQLHISSSFNYQHIIQRTNFLRNSFSSFSISTMARLEHRDWKLYAAYRINAAAGSTGQLLDLELTKRFRSNWTTALRVNQLLQPNGRQPEVIPTDNGYLFAEVVARPVEVLINVEWRFGG